MRLAHDRPYLPMCISHSVMSDSLQPQRTVAHQAPLSIGFFRQEYWSGSPCPPPGDLPDPGLLHCRWFLYCLSYHGSSYLPMRNTFNITNICNHIGVHKSEKYGTKWVGIHILVLKYLTPVKSFVPKGKNLFHWDEEWNRIWGF